ncbi:MAG: hypothetical protein HW421_3624 [Ignavibacteria bacterium]|nr:hypothetical protein [Ignavibacteria bacterium]
MDYEKVYKNNLFENQFFQFLRNLSMKQTFLLFLLLISISYKAFCQTPKDTIAIIEHWYGNTLQYQGKDCLIPQLESVMKQNQLASAELSKANTYETIAKIFSGAGGAFIGWPCGAAISGGKADWNLAYIGIGLVAVAIPFAILQSNHLEKAVEIYNAGIKSHSGNSNIRLDVGFSGKGIGMALRF